MAWILVWWFGELQNPYQILCRQFWFELLFANIKFEELHVHQL